MPAVTFSENSLADLRSTAQQDASVIASTLSALLFPNDSFYIPESAFLAWPQLSSPLRSSFLQRWGC